VRVYARRTIGKDNCIGGVKDSIEGLLSKGTTNGLFRSSDPKSQFIHSISTIVVTRNLHKIGARGNSQELTTVIEFTISSFATSDDATTARIGEAVDQAKGAYEQVVSLPSVFGVAGDAIPLDIDVVTKATAWEPLLEKI
jgi:hypothetical protein